MKLDIYDTHALHSDGAIMHFDVLLPKGADEAIARTFAIQWLNSIGVPSEHIRLENCQFCHSEPANPEIEQAISSDGYAIFQMEGCPSPI